MSRATNSERSPLLRIQSRQSDAPSFFVADVAPSTFQITAVCLLLVVARQAASLLATTAAADLNRAALCRIRHGHVADPTHDERCSEFFVLLDLDWLGTVEAILTTVMTIVAPIPIALAADRYGRRPFLVLALVGSVLNVGSRLCIYAFPQVFPLRLIWLSTSFELFAGGSAAFFAIIYTILTDVTLKAQRSTTFFHLGAASIFATQVGIRLTDLIPDKLSAGPALLAAFGILIFAILCAFCIPETIHLNKTIDNEEAIEEEPATQTMVERIRAVIPAAYRQVTASMAALFCRNKKLTILLLTVLVMEVNANSMELLTFYITYRFGLETGKKFSIYTVEAVSQFLLNTILLPLAAYALLSYNFSALRKDITLVRCGIVAAAIGLLGIGLAWRMEVMIAALLLSALITAYRGGILGLLSQLTGEDHVAVTFATTRVLATIGSLLSYFVFDNLFWFGSSDRKVLYGLPYIVLGCTYILVAIVVFVVTAGTGREPDYNEQD